MAAIVSLGLWFFQVCDDIFQIKTSLCLISFRIIVSNLLHRCRLHKLFDLTVGTQLWLFCLRELCTDWIWKCHK